MNRPDSLDEPWEPEPGLHYEEGPVREPLPELYDRVLLRAYRGLLGERAGTTELRARWIEDGMLRYIFRDLESGTLYGYSSLMHPGTLRGQAMMAEFYGLEFDEPLGVRGVDPFGVVWCDDHKPIPASRRSRGALPRFRARLGRDDLDAPQRISHVLAEREAIAAGREAEARFGPHRRCVLEVLSCTERPPRAAPEDERRPAEREGRAGVSSGLPEGIALDGEGPALSPLPELYDRILLAAWRRALGPRAADAEVLVRWIEDGALHYILRPPGPDRPPGPAGLLGRSCPMAPGGPAAQARTAEAHGLRFARPAQAYDTDPEGVAWCGEDGGAPRSRRPAAAPPRFRARIGRGELDLPEAVSEPLEAREAVAALREAEARFGSLRRCILEAISST